MIHKRRIILATFVALIFLYFFVIKYDFNHLLKLKDGNLNKSHQLLTYNVEPVYIETLALAAVVCGDRVEESLVMVKSALLLTRAPIHLHIFADDKNIPIFNKKLSNWKEESNRNFSFKVAPVKFPSGEFESAWRKLFKPCAAQRLFFPSLLKDVDALLYVDTDTLFLGPLEQIWAHFKLMNSSQIAALAPEQEDPLTGWYDRFARHPYYKPLGVNTGVMLMNLTRMRAFNWEQYMIPIYKKYKLQIPWGDQDIVNILFSFHPDKLYIYSCKYNYRADHCMYNSVCKVAEKEGIVVLHGSRGIFHNDKHPPFRSAYKAMEEYEWGTDLYKNFYLKLELYLNSSTASNCGKLGNSFLLNVKEYIQSPFDER